MEQVQLRDPREGPKPPFDTEMQEFPGREGKMNPEPDYGEHSYRGSGKLTGRKAVITGGDSGIGRAVALAFAREGADVAIAYLDEHGDAEKTKQLIEAEGRKAVIIPGDIQEYQHCKELIAIATKELDGLDVLVNNAAYQKPYDSLQEVTPEEFDRTFRTNVYAMFYLTQLAMEKMPPGSSIINVASIQAYEPNPTILPYAATKGAVVALTKGLAKDCISKGVRANVIAAGPVWTPFIPAAMPEEKVREFGKTNPTGRPAQPAELAPAFVLLASSDGNFINGEVLGVTGGSLLA